MGSNKITQLHVYIIGLVLAVIVGVGMYLGMVKPIEDDNAQLRTNITTSQTSAVDVYNAKQLTILKPGWDKTANEQIKAAKAEVVNEQAILAGYTDKRRLPPNEEINIGDGTPDVLLKQTMTKWLTLPRVLVTRMQ